MADLTRTREREQEASPGLKYDAVFNRRAKFIEQGMNGQIVVRETDREWELSRQAFLKFYILEDLFPETALHDWHVFVQDIKRESGKHRHQGGLVLFILEGKGATEVNGEIIEWEKGDCVLLPMDPNGCEHKHYNRSDGTTKWLALIYKPYWDHVCSEFVQLEVMQEFLQRSRA
jgi:mannose-6-phosphate isomerase-like protein (cupin superfamily)